MKINFNIAAVVLILVVVFFLGRGCNNNVITPNIDAKAIGTKIKKQLSERESLKKLADIQLDTVIKWKDRWHKAKEIHDSVPCPKKLTIVINTCDSALNAQCELLTLKDSIILKSDSIIGNYQNLVRIDSSIINNLTPRQYLLLGGDVTSGGNVFPSVGFDTKKGMFMVGYDPFNKQFKVSGYFKVKLWKRKK